VRYLVEADYPNVEPGMITAINSDLQDESDARRQVVKEALYWVFPYCLYVFGANLYKKDLTVQLPTPAYIAQRAKKHPGYFEGGRKAFMEKQYAEAVSLRRRIGCTDCSGFAVGILRKLKLVSNSFDTTANGFYHSYCKRINKRDLKPADLVFKRNASGFIPHMGLYLGAGYTIEAAGGAFGVQISRLDNHIIINEMTQRMEKRSAWALFGDLKIY
jgi:cell wall-associated NlpC family hydrolase